MIVSLGNVLPISFNNTTSIVKNENKIFFPVLPYKLLASYVSILVGRYNELFGSGGSIAPKEREEREPPKVIQSIKIYIENSASNQGYFSGATDAKGVIGGLLSYLGHKYKDKTSLYFISGQVILYNKPVNDFINEMTLNTVASTEGNGLESMLDSIASALDTGVVAFFISDCILSYSNDAISKNREINKQEASTKLKYGITNVFRNLKDKGYAASIFAFKSSFNGKYWNYQNGSFDLANAVRPYYIWAIGDRELLSQLNNEIVDNVSSFRYKEELNFGFSADIISDFEVLPSVERVGRWSKKSGVIGGVKDGDQICLLLDLKPLPSYARIPGYLEDNLELETKGAEVEVSFKEKADLDISKMKSDVQKNIFEKSSHALLLKINELRTSKGEVRIRLPLKKEDWYKEWSCMNDLPISECEERTFAFEYLIEGVKEAYTDKDVYFIDFTVQLNK